MKHDFLTRPLDHTRTQRTSRDVCRDFGAIETPEQEDSPWASTVFWITCFLSAVAVFIVISMEKM